MVLAYKLFQAGYRMVCTNASCFYVERHANLSGNTSELGRYKAIIETASVSDNVCATSPGLPGGIVHCPRLRCSAYMEMFRCMSTGACTSMMLANGHKSCNPIVERNILSLFTSARVPVGFYNNVANVVCLPQSCDERDRCLKPMCKNGERFKYAGLAHYWEAELALLNSRIIKRAGWRHHYKHWRLLHEGIEWPFDQWYLQSSFLEKHKKLRELLEHDIDI